LILQSKITGTEKNFKRKSNILYASEIAYLIVEIDYGYLIIPPYLCYFFIACYDVHATACIGQLVECRAKLGSIPNAVAYRMHGTKLMVVFHPDKRHVVHGWSGMTDTEHNGSYKRMISDSYIFKTFCEFSSFSQPILI